MKTNKTRIIIAAAIAAVSMAAFTGCSGTYSVDEKTGAVNISPEEATNSEQAASAGDSKISEENAVESSSETEYKEEEDNESNNEDSFAPVQSQAETTSEVTNVQENTSDVDTSALYQYATSAINALNTAGYNASGLQIRWGYEAFDENFEPCEEVSDSFRYWKLRDYTSDNLQEIRNILYGGYLSENICSKYDLYKAENAIVEHEGEYYFDSHYMGTGNYNLFESIEGSVNVIDADTYTVDAMHKDGMNISGDGRKCVITMRKVSGTDSWQIDSIQDL